MTFKYSIFHFEVVLTILIFLCCHSPTLIGESMLTYIDTHVNPAYDKKCSVMLYMFIESRLTTVIAYVLLPLV